MKTALRIVTLLFFSTYAAPTDDGKPSESAVTIDIPVHLEKANVVFNMNHMVLRGDVPLGMRYMDLMSAHFKEAGIQGQIIGVFYSEAAHLTLNDKAYNAFRGVATGNPNKELIARLMQQGVQLEECAESMRNHHWTNADLLPGIKVNTGATERLIQLTQQGYVQLQP